MHTRILNIFLVVFVEVWTSNVRAQCYNCPLIPIPNPGSIIYNAINSAANKAERSSKKNDRKNKQMREQRQDGFGESLRSAENISSRVNQLVTEFERFILPQNMNHFLLMREIRNRASMASEIAIEARRYVGDVERTSQYDDANAQAASVREALRGLYQTIESVRQQIFYQYRDRESAAAVVRSFGELQGDLLRLINKNVWELK